MRFKVLISAWVLWMIPAPSPLAQNKGSESQTPDLSNMFYTDTIPAPPKVQEPKPKPKATTKPKPRPAPVNISAERRTGLKYGILLRTPDCDVEEVDASHTFVSGDKIRLQLESNVDGYLYVVQKGSSGKDTLLFPDPRINNGDNHIIRGIRYSVPPRPWSISFDQNPGEEMLTVILSRTPLKSLPQQARPKEESSVSVVSVVEELNRNVQPRDLVLFQEKAPTVSAQANPISAPATQNTIVINTSEVQNSAVYTEIRLKHQ